VGERDARDDLDHDPPPPGRGYPAYILSVEPPVPDPEGLQLIRVRVDSPDKGQGETWFVST